MKKTHTRTLPIFEQDASKFGKLSLEYFRLYIGTNSLILGLIFFVCILISFKYDVIYWSYLKGLTNELTFFVGFFSVVFGLGIYSFWKLGKKSVYTIHVVRTKLLTNDVNVIAIWKDFCLGISSRGKINSIEFPSIVRALLCIGIVFNLLILTLDNGEFNKLQNYPSEVLNSESGFCPEKDEGIEISTPKQGCELIIRAYKLGYAKNLGMCEPKKVDPQKLKICEKRRMDEPYLHYMYRLLLRSLEKGVSFFQQNKVKKISDKFDLQLQQLEVLRDYQSYAMSASPRASHHIWTNLSYPENIFIQKYRELFNPNYCIERFQNQTNTVALHSDDERKHSKLLEHVYGQLLFNPKSEITVGFCKEYTIHWNSDMDICERLVNNPRAVLMEENILSEVELVLRRYDIANIILSLEDKIREIEDEIGTDNQETSATKSDNTYSTKDSKNLIVKSKIAKAKQQIRKKSEIVSFQCFMRSDDTISQDTKKSFTLQDTNYLVRTRYFPLLDSPGESQISMYNEFSKLLENRFHYSQLTSRSDINLEIMDKDRPADKQFLEKPTYLFTRLERLKNVDIFLGNSWVLERDDLLSVYPYHVHLKNYVNTFRAKYSESRGRL